MGGKICDCFTANLFTTTLELRPTYTWMPTEKLEWILLRTAATFCPVGEVSFLFPYFPPHLRTLKQNFSYNFKFTCQFQLSRNYTKKKLTASLNKSPPWLSNIWTCIYAWIYEQTMNYGRLFENKIQKNEFWGK